MTSQFADMTLSLNFFWRFRISSLVVVSSFMSISLLVLEIISFIRDWPKIRKSETTLSEFWPISGDWGELKILNLSRKFPADMVTFTKEILNGKLYFLCSGCYMLLYCLFRAEKIWYMFVSCIIRIRDILLRGIKHRARKLLSSNHYIRRASENLILDLILSNWKVIGCSKRDLIEDFR